MKRKDMEGNWVDEGEASSGLHGSGDMHKALSYRQKLIRREVLKGKYTKEERVQYLKDKGYFKDRARKPY